MAETLLQQAFDKSRESLISAICKLKRAKRLEYVESTGTQYVDTGVIITPQSSVSLDVAFTSISTGAADAQHNGVVKGSDSGNYRIIIGADNGLKKVYSIGLTLQLSADLDRHVFLADYKNLVVSIDSATLNISGTFTGSFTQSFYMFARNESGTASLFCHEKLYGAQFRQNDTLVRDYIPVKDSAGVAGLLDLVSGQIFYSATSTSLVAGPEATPYFSRIEYLESTGTQYIDTGVVGGSSSGVEIVASSQNVSEYYALFGARTSGTEKSFSAWQRATSGSGLTGFRVDFFETGSTSTRFAFLTNWEASGSNSFRKAGNQNWLNGVQSDNVAATFACDYSFFLFAVNSAGAATYPFVGRVYSCAIYDGSTLVRDFVPVRVGQVGYLFDRVSKQFFGNAGTGSFVLGPDVA